MLGLMGLRLGYSSGGASGPLTVAFLGDPQIGSGAAREQGDILNYRRQARYLTASGINHVVELGDVINNGSATQAEWQHDAFLFCRRELSGTVYPNIGNHDIWNTSTGLESTGGSAALTAFLADGGRAEDLGFSSAARAAGGSYTVDISENGQNVRLICWNADPTRAAGYYPTKYTGTEHDDQMAWLVAALRAAGTWRGGDASKHIVLCLHYPPFLVSQAEANNEENLPNGLTGFTYNDPRDTIVSEIRAAGCTFVMAGHTATNQSVTVAESSGGAGDGFQIFTTTGSSILSSGQLHAMRTLTFNGSSATQAIVYRNDMPEFTGYNRGDQARIVASDALHFFRFGEAQGIAVVDEMGVDAGAMRWTYSGTPTFGVDGLDDSDDTAVTFAGGYVYSAGPFTPLTGSQSYEMRLKWTNTAAVQGVLQCGALGGAGANTGVTLRITATGILEWNVADGSGNRQTITAGQLTAGQAHHVIAVYDADEAQARLYLDGALAGSTTVTGFTASAGTLLQIGTAGAQRFYGTLDEFNIREAATLLSEAGGALRYGTLETGWNINGENGSNFITDMGGREYRFHGDGSSFTYLRLAGVETGATYHIRTVVTSYTSGGIKGNDAADSDLFSAFTATPTAIERAISSKIEFGRAVGGAAIDMTIRLDVRKGTT